MINLFGGFEQELPHSLAGMHALITLVVLAIAVTAQPSSATSSAAANCSSAAFCKDYIECLCSTGGGSMPEKKVRLQKKGIKLRRTKTPSFRPVIASW